MGDAFAIWLTGLPASGKSSIARVVRQRLADAGVAVEVLESDEVRRVLTPEATYGMQEREVFYRALAFFGSRLVAHGIPVLFDATANRRQYRDLARSLIPRFLEVAIVCPLAVCQERDRKGTYQRGRGGESTTVPGLQDPYEPPLRPDLEIDSVRERPEEAADRVMALLHEKGFL